jgi:hypothetical protein
MSSGMNNKPYPAMKDYTWTVFYEDGTSIQQFDDERPDGREWAALPAQKHVGVLVLNHTLFPHSIYVKIPDDAQAIFVCRHIIVIGMSPDNPVPEEVSPRAMVYITGWVKEDGTGAYNFLCENGTQIFSDDFQAM